MDPGFAARANRCHSCHGQLVDGDCPFCHRLAEVLGE